MPISCYACINGQQRLGQNGTLPDGKQLQFDVAILDIFFHAGRLQHFNEGQGSSGPAL